MLTVCHIRVRSLETDYAHVFWQIEPTAEDPVEYDFYVLRSEGQAGPYTVLSAPIIDGYIFTDSTARDERMWRNFYYRIRCVNRSTGDMAEFGSNDPREVLERGIDPGGVSKDQEAPLILKEIIRRERLALRTYTGRAVIVFPIRTFGQRCPSCWDPVKKQRADDHCLNCYGSSFSGGFFRPIQIFGSFRRPGIQDNLSSLRVESHQEEFFTSNFPVLKQRDIVVEIENDRWRVDAIQPSEARRVLVSQRAAVAPIPKSDIEYRLPLQGIDPIRFEPIDVREYTRPMNLESAREAASRRTFLK